MKRKITQNSNGISISDSIIMSVKQKHSNIRKPFSIAIAVMGFISVIMSFLGMFPIHFHTKTVIFSGIDNGALVFLFPKSPKNFLGNRIRSFDQGRII